MSSRKPRRSQLRAMNEDTVSEQVPSEYLLPLLQEGEIRSAKLMPWGSNYTFLVNIQGGGGEVCEAIYKPQSGERPLGDFPQGTLYKREYATYVVSKALGWLSVPPTVIREGPHGVGSVQLYIESEPEANYFTLRDEHAEEFRRVAAFDCLINNADRKVGHCLMGLDGRIWLIDHGLAFHSVFKLRTVIWDFCGDPIPESLLEGLEGLVSNLASTDGLAKELSKALSEEELEALAYRARVLLENPVLPNPGPYRNVPWPWI